MIHRAGAVRSENEHSPPMTIVPKLVPCIFPFQIRLSKLVLRLGSIFRGDPSQAVRYIGTPDRRSLTIEGTPQELSVVPAELCETPSFMIRPSQINRLSLRCR